MTDGMEGTRLDRGNRDKGGLRFSTMTGSVIAGGIAGAASYSLQLPFQMVQSNSGLFYSPSEGIRAIRTQHGWGGVMKGFSSSYIGYALQGAARFGFYERYKKSMMTRYPLRSERYKVWLVASGLAEFVAVPLLAPFEALRHRLQVVDPVTLRPKIHEPMIAGLMRMQAEKGLPSMFKGLPSLWAIHVPFTMIQFVVYERLMEYAEGHWMSRENPMSRFWQVVEASFASGFVGGAVAGLATTPLVNLLMPPFKESPGMGGKRTMAGSITGAATTPMVEERSKRVASYFKSAPNRIILFGLIGGLQWSLYQGIKVYLTGKTP